MLQDSIAVFCGLMEAYTTAEYCSVLWSGRNSCYRQTDMGAAESAESLSNFSLTVSTASDVGRDI